MSDVFSSIRNAGSCKGAQRANGYNVKEDEEEMFF